METEFVKLHCDQCGKEKTFEKANHFGPSPSCGWIDVNIRAYAMSRICQKRKNKALLCSIKCAINFFQTLESENREL